MIASRHASRSPPVDRSMTVSAPQRSAQRSFSTSSSVPLLTGEAPMLAFTLVFEARPMAMGSRSYFRCTRFAGMINRPAATSSRTCSGVRCDSRSDTLCISGVTNPKAGLLELRHRALCSTGRRVEVPRRVRRRSRHARSIGRRVRQRSADIRGQGEAARSGSLPPGRRVVGPMHGQREAAICGRLDQVCLLPRVGSHSRLRCEAAEPRTPPIYSADRGSQRRACPVRPVRACAVE